MRSSVYSILRSLAAPASPGEVNIIQIKKLSGDHFEPALSEIVRFNSRIWQPKENIAEYMAQLHKIAKYCNYELTLGTMLRVRLVCGLPIKVKENISNIDDNAIFHKG